MSFVSSTECEKNLPASARASDHVKDLMRQLAGVRLLENLIEQHERCNAADATAICLEGSITLAHRGNIVQVD